MLTTIEAALLLGVERQQVWRLVKAGRLPAVRQGRDWFIDRQEIERYQSERRKAGRPPKP